MMRPINWNGLESRAVFSVWVLLGIGLGIQISGESALGQSAQVKDKALDELHIVGQKASEAILNKDIEAILRYDRPDLVKDDRNLLMDKTSDLYCYLFDTSCITFKGRSVYEVLRSAQKLTIKVQDLRKGKDGFRYGLLYFFDAVNIDQKRLTSPDYLCEKGGKEIITWTFRRVKGKWESAHPPFDAETDVHCNP